MPRLSNNSVSVRGRQPSYQRDQVDNEAAPVSSGMRMRQRCRHSETRGLTLGSVLSAGQTRSQARSATNSRTRLRSVSSVQRNKGDFRFSMAPSVHLGTFRSKSRHGPSARAVIRITGPQKNSVTPSGTVSLRASPVTLHIITSHGLPSASPPKTDTYSRVMPDPSSRHRNSSSAGGCRRAPARYVRAAFVRRGLLDLRWLRPC